MLDELGQKIIKELQEDARQSFREIGRNLQVSEGTVRNRVKGMLKTNAMKISAIPNPEKLGMNFICIMGIEVKVGSAERVEALLIECPNVYFLCGCTGNIDIMGIFVFRKGVGTHIMIISDSLNTLFLYVGRNFFFLNIILISSSDMSSI